MHANVVFPEPLGPATTYRQGRLPGLLDVLTSSSHVAECVAQESALSLERLPWASRLLHQCDLLRQQASEVEGIGSPILSKLLVQWMVSIEVHDTAFGITLWRVAPEVVNTATESLVTELQPSNDRRWGQGLDLRTSRLLAFPSRQCRGCP